MQAIAQPNQGYIKTGSASIVLALVMVLLLAVSSWSACRTGQYSYFVNNPGGCPVKCGNLGKPVNPNQGPAGTVAYGSAACPDCYATDCRWGASAYCSFNYVYTSSCSEEEQKELICKDNPSDPSCHIPDTTWTCESVYTENLVVRAQVTMKVDGVATSENTVLGSCSENGFCDGVLPNTLDSCSYDSISTKNCKFGGQNGSACHYICPDGRNHLCRQAWNGGINIPECPQKPWKACADSIYKPRPPKDTYNPDNYNPPSDSQATTPTDRPEMENEILLAIRDTLHHANEQRKYQAYVQEKQYDVIAGLGDYAGDGVLDNIKNVASNTNAVKQSVDAVKNAVTNIKKDTLKVEVVNMIDYGDDKTDSVYVVNLNQTDYSPLVFKVDTVAEYMGEINDLIDTLVNDTPRTNQILLQTLPGISVKLDSLRDFFTDGTSAGFIYRNAQATTNAMMAQLRPLLEVDVSDTLTWADDMADVDTTLPEYKPNLADTLDGWADKFVGKSWFNKALDQAFYQDADSMMRALDSIHNAWEEMAKDTTKDSLPLDKMSGDSLVIRQKLSKVFLAIETQERCFDFHVETTLGKWAFNLFIDFADMFGFDLCAFIRMVVRLFTFIAIVLTTVKGFIRAFGGTSGSSEG